MTFDYKVRDLLGDNTTGTIDANTLDEAQQKLQRQGYTVLRIEEQGGEYNLFARGVKKTELIYLTSQLAIMVDTGINLSTALAGLAEQEQNPTLKLVMDDIRSRVEAGDTFSAALAKHPKQFDRTYISLVRASEETGTLGQMLDRIANYMRNELETRGKVRGAMAYPTIMAVVALGVTIFLLGFVMPKFTPLFESKGMKLPTVTMLMLTLSKTITGYWWAWLAGIAALVGGYIAAMRTLQGIKLLDFAKINAPLIGPMVRKVTISRCIRTLGTLLKSGVSVLDAIQLSANVCGNYWYEQAWLHVLDQLKQGSQINEALKGNLLFPSTLIQMIGSGEETGKLEYVLEKVSSYYDKEVEMSLKTLTSLIEPLMIIVMGGVVGTIGLSLMLPIFQLSRGH